jgi:hypothetical protein
MLMATFPLILKHALERQHSAQVQARIARETGTTEPHPNNAQHGLPGDPWRLRGIPIVGVHGGIGGAINGSRPGTRLDNVRQR